MYIMNEENKKISPLHYVITQCRGEVCCSTALLHEPLVDGE